MSWLILADECIKIKNRKAQQTKAIKQLPAKYRIGLSGYPIANKIEDLWSQIDWVYQGYLGTFWGFDDTYILRGIFKEVLGYKNIEQLKSKLDPIYIRRLKSEVLTELPPKIYQTRYIELSEAELKAYNQMKLEMCALIQTMTEEEIFAKASTILVQLLRLSQITSGFITDITMKSPAWIGNSKFEELDTIVDEVLTSGNQLVIWSRWVPCIMALKDRYAKYNAVYLSGSVPAKERMDNIDKFQRGESKVFCGQMQSGGMGITLHAANVEVFLDKAFISPSTVIQAEGRCHRIGQTKTVTIISLIAKNTIDEKWEQMMKEKQKIAEEILRDDRFAMGKQQVLDILET